MDKGPVCLEGQADGRGRQGQRAYVDQPGGQGRQLQGADHPVQLVERAGENEKEDEHGVAGIGDGGKAHGGPGVFP